MSTLRIANLSKRFGSSQVLKDVSLEVDDGEFLVLLGPSGCGKSTTLRCIAGLETPDSGDIFIDGERANDIPPKERDVAMVFQNYALYPHMSVFDNMAFPLQMRKSSKREVENRVHEIAKLLNIEKFLSRKPRELSGGEQQRVALARAIVRQPKLFLMDEPLSNLDAKLRLYTRTEIKKLQQQLKVTTVYVTHDQAEAMSMADEITIMNQGQVVQTGAPFAIYDRPADTFVAGFVGSPPMNLIEATLESGDGRVSVLDTGSFKFELPNMVVDSRTGQARVGEVILGLRPEDMELSSERPSNAIFEAEVYAVEPQGSSTLVDLRVDGQQLRCTVQRKFAAAGGSRIWVIFPPERVYVFDAKTRALLA